MSREAPLPAGFERAMARSETVFAEALELSADTRGVTRPSFSDKESQLLDLLDSCGTELGLESRRDISGNLYLTLPGANRNLPGVLMGSHADSVPQGGNFDGLAGILAGIACLEMLLDGQQPSCDVSVMAIRGEENAWFGAQHIGSQAALGLFDQTLLDSAIRSDSGRSLADHMFEIGLDLEALRHTPPQLTPANVRCFLELHIEQGPILVQEELPAAIVTGIRGNVRCPRARCYGEGGHAGIVPLSLRHDAVVATAELVAAVQTQWRQRDVAGDDVVLTFGRFHTDADADSVTTVPRRVDFSFEVRSHTPRVLEQIRAFILEEAATLSQIHGVQFNFETWTHSPPAEMHADLLDKQRRIFRELQLEPFEMACGAGHDVQDFIAAGIPAAMIFIRNEHGSHNPDESMAMDDYATAVRVLLEMVQAETQ